jgi:hypothetical protein
MQCVTYAAISTEPTNFNLKQVNIEVNDCSEVNFGEHLFTHNNFSPDNFKYFSKIIHATTMDSTNLIPFNIKSGLQERMYFNFSYSYAVRLCQSLFLKRVPK